MKKLPSELLSCACLFAAACVPANLFGEDSHRVNIEEIRDLSLSGFNDDAGGELKWRLEATSAEADSRTKSEDVRRTSWNLRDLRLFTFGEAGEEFAKMTSAAGVFNPEKREARSTENVRVEGKNFSVRGKGWAWSGDGHENEIRVLESVVVSLTPPGKQASETLSVVADALLIRGERERTTLVFSGKVTVFYAETTMNCDALEILVEGDGTDAAGLGGASELAAASSASAAGTPASGDGNALPGGGRLQEKIMRIAGSGNVRVEHAGKILNGDFAEFFPREERFRVRENVRLRDPAERLSVAGDFAEGKIRERVIEISANKPNAELKAQGSPVAVAVRMPSVAGKNSAASAAAPADVWSRRILVESFSDKNVISFFGDVHAVDGDLHIRADEFVAETDPDSKDSLLLDPGPAAGTRREKISVRKAVAEGNVRAVSEGRILTCARADLFPQKNFILLTGEPRVDSPEENFSLSGERVEIFSDADRLDVFSADGNAPDRRRVAAKLPGLAAATAARAGTPAARRGNAPAAPAGTQDTTEIFGDHLRVTRTRADENCIDVSGNVDLRSETANGKLVGGCDRLVLFVDATRSRDRGSSRTSSSAADDAAGSRIRKIIADGNVELEQSGYVLSGGRAEITPSVGLKEWVPEDRAAPEDAGDPFVVVVTPTPENAARPRITFEMKPLGASGLNFSFGNDGGSEAGSSATPSTDENSASRKTVLESDKMELIAGERSRARFFLRGNVEFRTDGGASGRCDEVEGLLVPAAGTEQDNFEAKEVVCRGNIAFEQDGAVGRGLVLEIFPPQDRAVLSGDAYFRDKGGVELRPGNDRFVFDLEKRQMLTGEDAAGTPGDVPAQVARPQIIIPKGSRNIFVIPKSLGGDPEKR